MTLFPTILYFFQSLPIPIRKDHLKSLQSRILNTPGETRGIPQNTLFLHRPRGRLGLPNLHKYYVAARLAQLSTIYTLPSGHPVLYIRKPPLVPSEDPPHTLPHLVPLLRLMGQPQKQSGYGIHGAPSRPPVPQP